MKTAYFALRVLIAPLVACVIAAMAWYMWLQEDLMTAYAEYHE